MPEDSAPQRSFTLRRSGNGPPISTLAARVTLIYGAAALLWILLSDWAALFIAPDASNLYRVQLIKGLGFVLVTSLLLFVVLRAETRRRMAARLDAAESEERYRLLFMNNPHPMWVYDLESLAFLAVNDAAVEQYGYSEAEFLGMTIKDIRPPQEVARLLDNIKHNKDVLQKSGIWQHTRKDGTLIDVEIMSHALDFGGIPARLVAAMDVTERKRAEENLRESEERYRDLYENAPNAYFSIDAEGRIVKHNRRAEELLGYPAGSLIGRRIFELYADTPDGKTRARQVLERLHAGETVRGEELEMQRADGSALWIALTVNAVQDAAGQLIASRSIAVDITGRKQAQQAREHYARRLEVLHEVDRGILAADTLEDLVGTVVRYIRQLIPCQRAAVGLFEPKTNTCLVFAADLAQSSSLSAGARVQMSSPWREELGKGQVINIPDLRTYTGPDYPAQQRLAEEGFASTLHIPMLVEGKLIGAVSLAAETVGFFTPEHEEIATEIASQLAIAIQQARLKEHLSQSLEEVVRSERALRESEERFRTTLYSIGDAVITTDTEGCVLVMNPVAEMLTGWSEAEAQSKPIGDVFKIVNEQTRELTENPIRRVLEEGVIVGLANHTLLIARSGREQPIADSGAPVRNEQGEITGTVLVFRDQTEERAAQEALAESEERFRTVFKKTAVGYSLTTLEGTVQVNEAFAAMLGYSVDEMIGLNFTELTHPEDVAMSLECSRALLEGERDTYRMEKRYLHKDGHIVWAIVSATLLRDQQGSPQFFITSIQDISERKRAEEALQHQYQYLAALYEITLGLLEELDFNNLLDVIITRAAELASTSHGFIDVVDPEINRLRLGSAIGNFRRDVGMLIEPGQGASGTAWQTARTVVVEDYRVYEQALAHFEWLHAIVCIPLVVGGTVIGVIGLGYEEAHTFTPEIILGLEQFANLAALTLQNARLYESAQEEIHERRLAEERAERLLAQQMTIGALTLEMGDSSDLKRIYRTIYERISEMMDADFFAAAFYDAETQLIQAGYVVAEGNDLDVKDFPAIPLEPEGKGIQSRVIHTGQPYYLADLRAALQDVQTQYSVDEKGRVSKGVPPEEAGEIVRSALYVPMKIEGRIIGVLQVQSYRPDAYTREDMDLLSGLANVAAIAIQNARLIAELEEHRLELEHRVAERTAELVAANAVKDEFVSNVSHELRTPLAGIKLHVDLLARHPDGSERYLQRMRREVARLELLVEDLLTISRLDQDRVKFAPEPVDLTRIAAGLVEDRQVLAKEHQVGLFYEGGQAAVPALADGALIEQVAGILITNALNYTPAGGEVHVLVGPCEDGSGGWSCLSVRDSGPGITPQEQEHIFERFYRGTAGRESGQPGTGLGLAIAKEIVTRHGGHIEVHSSGVLGEGAQFEVWLPAVVQTAGAPA